MAGLTGGLRVNWIIKSERVGWQQRRAGDCPLYRVDSNWVSKVQSAWWSIPWVPTWRFCTNGNLWFLY